jgi:predicted Zn finger-like uncharacterized protein
MFTNCPACRMNLAVTAADLRIGQGYVRCGRCERVFNALLTLAEDVNDEQQSGLAATGTTSVPALQDSGTQAPPDPDDDVTDVPIPDAPPPPAEDDSHWAMITPIHAPATHEVDVVESNATGTFETIVLEGDGYLQTEEHVDELEVDAQLQELARQMDTRNTPPLPDDIDVEDDARPGEDIVMETDAGQQEDELDADAAVGNPRRHHWAWSVAAAVLLLTLLAQLVHHNRQALVAQPWGERPMRALYAAFGVTLEPKWDLRAYDVRRLGEEPLSAASDRITLRASVHNRAANGQPPPMIRVVLQDRFGNTLSTTDIAPADYLRSAGPARMAPDQRLDAQLTVPDPTRQADGFVLDVCLPGTDGSLHCSDDQ